MKEILHECDANERQEHNVIRYDDVWGWALGTKLDVEGPVIKHCPYCGLKLEKPDVKIEVYRGTMELWAVRLEGVYHTVNGKARVSQRVADSIRTVLGHRPAVPNKIEVSQDDLSMLVCEANQMVVDLSYGRSVAVRAKNLWRRLRATLYGQREEEPEPPEPDEGAELRRLQAIEKALLAGIPREGIHGILGYLWGLHANESDPFWRDYLAGVIKALKVKPGPKIRMAKVTWALLEDWDLRLREIALLHATSSKTAHKILNIVAHMRALLNCYREEPCRQSDRE